VILCLLSWGGLLLVFAVVLALGLAVGAIVSIWGMEVIRREEEGSSSP
jgi:hypothetical protein